MNYLIIVAFLIFAFALYKVVSNKKTEVKKGNGYGGGKPPVDKDQNYK